MSSPRVCSFIGSTVNGSSFAVGKHNPNQNAQLGSVTHICRLVQLQCKTLAVRDILPKMLGHIHGHGFTVPCNCIS